MMKFLRFSSLVLLLAAGAAARAAESASTLQPANYILEHFVDWLQWRIFPDGAHSDLIHWIARGGLFLAAILLRRVVTHIIFRGLKKLSEKTETTLDDKLYPALEQPVAAFIMVLGIFGALTVLQLSPAVDALISHGAIIAILAVLFWGLLRAGGAVHQEFVTVNFTDYNDSSLDIQFTYFTADPDFKIHLAVRERINLKIMRVVAARGLSFALPTRTLQFEGELANRMAGIGPQP